MMADDANSWDAAIDLAIPLIKQFEGFAAKPYLCPAGKWTVGYGHVLIVGEIQPNSMTQDHAENLLREDLHHFVQRLNRIIRCPVTTGMRAALLSLVYNVGIYALHNSTLLRLINAGDYEAAAEQFERWNKATDPRTGQRIILPGLARRREAERALFLRDWIPS